jgi:hypothetical protein
MIEVVGVLVVVLLALVWLLWRMFRLLERMADDITRMKRVELGLPEQPREHKPLEPMPDTLRHLIDSWDSQASRRHQGQEAYRAFARGKGWEAIERDMREQVGSP